MKHNTTIYFFAGILAIFFAILGLANEISNFALQSPNQEMYLRKISNQLDVLNKRLDNTPSNEREYDSIKKRGEEAEFMLGAYMAQLKLLYTGKVRTGWKVLLINLLPTSFLNNEEIEFDAYTQMIERYYAEVKHYTKEELKIIRKTLLERSESIIEWWCKHQIDSAIPRIVEASIAEEMVRRNHYRIPQDFDSPLSGENSVWDQLYDESNGKRKKLFDALLDHGVCACKKLAVEMFMPINRSV